jgi:hypothetical protein
MSSYFLAASASEIQNGQIAESIEFGVPKTMNTDLVFFPITRLGFKVRLLLPKSKMFEPSDYDGNQRFRLKLRFITNDTTYVAIEKFEEAAKQFVASSQLCKDMNMEEAEFKTQLIKGKDERYTTFLVNLPSYQSIYKFDLYDNKGKQLYSSFQRKRKNPLSFLTTEISPQCLIQINGMYYSKERKTFGLLFDLVQAVLYPTVMLDQQDETGLVIPLEREKEEDLA